MITTRGFTDFGTFIKKKFIINGKKENFEVMRMQTIEKIYAPAKQ